MRNLTIRARIILLICIAIAFASLVGGGFYFQLHQLRKYAIGQTQQVMLEGQKDKLHVLETAVVSWTKQIRSVLGADPDAALKVRRRRWPVLSPSFRLPGPPPAAIWPMCPLKPASPRSTCMKWPLANAGWWRISRAPTAPRPGRQMARRWP